MARTRPQPLVALVGGDTLLAREIRELLEDGPHGPRVQLISAAGDGSASFAAGEEEALILTPLSAASLEGASVALLAGSAAASRRALKLIPPEGPRLIDLTGSLEDQPEARLRAPSAEPAGTASSAGIQVIAHPAAIALAMLLGQLSKLGTVRRSVAHVFEPASERGQRGVEELQKQTVAVLSLKPLPTEVFDTQIAFNMLARYGEEAMEPLEGVEQRLERHLASLLHAWPGVAMPSLRLIQAPVFHGHSVSVWLEFDESPDAAAIAQALASAGFDVRPDEPPANAGIAGLSGVSAGAIATDPNNPRACWIWLVADNLKLAAENAVAVAKESL